MAHALIHPAFHVVYAHKASMIFNHGAAPLAGMCPANDPDWEKNLPEREGFVRDYPEIWSRTPLYIKDVSGHKRLDGARAVAVLREEGSSWFGFFRQQEVAVTDTAISLRKAFEKAGFGDVPVTMPEQCFLPEVFHDLAEGFKPR